MSTGREMNSAICCAVCFDEYDGEIQARHPHVLRCGHTFCKRCITLAAQGMASLRCPTCRKSNKVAKTVLNFALLQVIDDLKEKVKAKKKPLTKTEAATKIQAVFRGLATRATLGIKWVKIGSWKVPISDASVCIRPGDPLEQPSEMCTSAKIGGGGSIGERVRLVATLLELLGFKIHGFERTCAMIWTIIFVKDSKFESFTVYNEILRTDKADLHKVISEHLGEIEMKRQAMKAEEKAAKEKADKKAAKYSERQARRLVEHAQVQLRNRDFDGAVQSLREAISQNSRNKEAKALLARVLEYCSRK